MPREILVVKRGTLFDGKTFQGFLSSEEKDFMPIILSNFEFQERDAMEEDPSFQQVVPYVWIVNKKAKQVFAYKRAPDQRYDEARLRNKWSCGLGGHVDKEKTTQENPINEAMLRELQEEVKMSHTPQPNIIGFLNDDLSEVGKVHFGVVALVETEGEVTKGDDEMTHGQFYSIEEIDKLFSNPENDVESWTQLSWPHVKNYLNTFS